MSTYGSFRFSAESTTRLARPMMLPIVFLSRGVSFAASAFSSATEPRLRRIRVLAIGLLTRCLTLRMVHFEAADLNDMSSVIDLVHDGKWLDNQEPFIGAARLSHEFRLISKRPFNVAHRAEDRGL